MVRIKMKKMNRKGDMYDFTEFMMTYGWAILVVLIAIGALVYFGLIAPPDWFFDNDEICDVSCPEGFIECTHEVYGESSNGCLLWHKPTLCEKCLDDWTEECEQECVCDEEKIEYYLNINIPKELGTCLNYIGNGIFRTNYSKECIEFANERGKYIKTKCLLAHQRPTPIKINLGKEKCVKHTSISYIPYRIIEVDCQYYIDTCDDGITSACDLIDEFCCAKKEPLNPCEKNNPDYKEVTIVDCGGIRTELQNDWEEKGFDALCDRDAVIFINESGEIEVDYEIEKICRKKTIKDLTCTELFDYLTNGQNVACRWGGKCKYPNPRGLFYTYPSKYLKNTLMEKDCIRETNKKDTPKFTEKDFVVYDTIYEINEIKEGDYLKFTKDYTPFKKGDTVKVFEKQIGQVLILAVRQPNGYDRNIEDKGFIESIIAYEPKNECEKGNIDWIEENIYETKTLPRVPDSAKIDKNCSKTHNEFCEGMDGLCTVLIEESFCAKFKNETILFNNVSKVITHCQDCYMPKEVKTLNKTICRKKTIEDLSCFQLWENIKRNIGSFGFNKFKTAFEEKGCLCGE